MSLINIMKMSAGKAAWLVLLGLSISNISYAEQELLLYEGEVKVMRIGGVDRVAVGNSKVISTSIVKNGQLVMIGERVGITSMHIWKKGGQEMDYKVVVTDGDSEGDIADLEELLSTIPGVSVRNISGKSVINGVVSPEQKKVIKVMIKAYPNVLDMTRVSAVAGDTRMILLNVKFTEFKTNKLEKLGIVWSTDIPGPGAGYANLGRSELSASDNTLDSLFSGAGSAAFDVVLNNPPIGYFGILTEITSRINFLASSGDAIILAEPRLSARSGGTAEFIAGGEVPIPMQTRDGIQIEYKKYGIILNISPIADANGNVQAKVEAEVSTIDTAVTVNGAPGFLTRSTSTDISLKSKETLVISGLVSNEISNAVDKVKFLGDLPILGPLFRSKTFNAKKSELVIFVTPTVYDANSAENKKNIKIRERLMNTFTKNVDQGDNILD
ncbi:MAG: pilus assembly protein N-terminal domain-containing protein [Gammaproteobacteria bacterium]|nr:MAG: pilus assembly protein N-terminal domain-containing protein [Gammaproteobacteria bacterium]